MNNLNPVHIICILDRSGSMSSLTSEVIGSFNHFLDEQKAEDGEAKLTLVLFDNEYEVVYDQVDIKEVKHIDNSIYYTRGMTAMNDAIGMTISKYTDADAIVLIQTDGHENSSSEYTRERVKELITEKEKLGWDFTFLGANIDAQAEAQSLGISVDKAVQFAANASGVTASYASMDMNTKLYRASKRDITDLS